ncbi:MAG: AMP-binding protein [Candidatus Jordarchaeum sp.]|uniref:AMP-binding protein n=1 Tax=Candidatus Jordarchaeum sp. TaxID=2823881 RepID=UPI00404BA3C6
MEKPWLKLWPSGVPKSLKYPEMPVYNFLSRAAKKIPNRILSIYNDREITYGEYEELTNRFASALIELGVKKGDRIAIHLLNVPQFVISYFGALKAGATIFPCNPLLVERELETLLNDSGTETIITFDIDLTYKKVESVKDKTKLRNVIKTGLDDYLLFPEKILSPDTERKKTEEAKKNDDYLFPELLKVETKTTGVKVNPKEDLAHLSYTGGTTGTPKGVMLTHFNVTANIMQNTFWMIPLTAERDIDIPIWQKVMMKTEKSDEEIAEELQAEGIEATPEDVARLINKRRLTFAAVPWFHAMGMIAYLCLPICNMQTMVIFLRFDPKEYLEAIEKYKPDAIGGAPPMFVPLLNHPDFKKYDLSSVKLIASGAAPLPVTNLKRLQEATSGTVIEAYGLTEVTMGVLYNPASKDAVRKPGSVGMPLIDTDAKIVDAETGTKELSPGELGEIVVKGPQIMKGYWNKPEETKNVLREGWLHTGDLGKMDEDGYFYIVDRKKDMLKYKGYSVFPRDIEEVLHEHPAVKECAVIGKPDESVGELPVAFVVLKEGASATKEELIDYVSERVAPYKKIRDVIFKDMLPISLAGKVLRRVLREEISKMS